MLKLNRRAFLSASAATLATPALLRAQSGAIKIGTLTPLTGVGGTYGPSMRDAILGVVAQVNEAGGILGRQIEVASEDTQTSPEAAVRAARKLIDVDGVSAILGTWASSITTAVAPLAWESKTMLMCVSGADSITKLPHQGFICRTQPNSILQIQVAGDFMVAEGATQMAWIGPQTPFAASSIDILEQIAAANGAGMESLIYEADKSTYRSEVDQILRGKPDFIMLGGYAADSTVLLRDIWQAGYEGKIIGPAYAVNAGLLDTLPSAVTEGIYTWEGAPAVNSAAYANVKAILGVDEVDPYSAQTYDHASLTILAMAAGGDSSGDTVRQNVRSISQGDGQIVESAVDGLAALAGGINYSGASGPCDFNEIGDITGTQFVFKTISGGKPSEYKRV
ncbi:Branched-chain amino acid ABC transporter, amino acid-binding protein [Candidatus Rhodobacter oscarellae]|uniref:Branched-chain amino acid ABC transporter, amino acid-binding protein n=1 Tax=Candidatus Rhodobacter oscarellae TaxID=1675527 RepID=A0A0J9E6H2_9RHOB|nr:ABC transporter substrate-binding protein [Candidatus Rhodobacter lobularis]KMW58277.1 Branched-chain amino acid ABC transporter, amino acid-binding protein [Candidatus Rhodobacter lobularis]